MDLFGGERFIVLKNYARALSDPIFSQAVKSTLIFVSVSVPTLVILELFLTLALNKTTKGSSFLRGLHFTSSILSVTIVTLIWRIIFIPNDGLMALILNYSGWQPIGFLSTTGWSLFSVGVATWFAHDAFLSLLTCGDDRLHLLPTPHSNGCIWRAVK